MHPLSVRTPDSGMDGAPRVGDTIPDVFTALLKEKHLLSRQVV